MKIKEIKGVHTTEVASKWEDFQAIRDKYALDDDWWLYRGQDNCCWEIRSTFERTRENSGKSDAWKYEAMVVREFKRRAHLYLENLPEDHDILEWLSLLRHFGAPCRLVDVTYSFYVAIYFAIRSLVVKSPPAAIWAFDTRWLKKQWNRLFPNETIESIRGGDFRFKEPGDFRKHFLDFNKTKPFIAPSNPFRQNERLTAQQGLFLCPGDISKSFMENLISDQANSHEKNILRIPIMASIKPKAIQELRRMNISLATLFPDLGGFAESLSDWFALDLPFNDKDLLKALCI